MTLSKALGSAQGILFDFDNVVVDSEPLHFEAYEEVFSRYGHRLDKEEYWIHWTSLGEGSEGEVRRHGLDLDPAAIRDEKRVLFSEICASGRIRFYPESFEAIRLLQAAGKKLAVASGTPTTDLETLLSKGRLTESFDVVLGRDQVERGKPHPDIFLEAARRIGVEPKSCLVFEDAEKGVAAARAGEIPVAVIRTAYTQSIRFDDADWVLDDHEAFLAAVREATAC